MRPGSLMLAAVVAVVPALAQARPLLLPAQDVTVEYHSTGMVPGPAGELTNTVMVSFASQRQRLRIDGPQGGFYTLVDIDAARMTTVLPGQRIFVDQPMDQVLLALLDADTSDFRAIGRETVAGQPCTAYTAAVNDHHGLVCLTNDGVLLRAMISAPDRRPALEAVSVTYGRQPAALFEVPAGFRRLDLARLPFGQGFDPFRTHPSNRDINGQIGR